MIEKFLMKLRARDAVSEEEAMVLERLVGRVQEVPSDKTVIRAGDELTESVLLLDGLMCRYKDLRDGSRQISELHVPGDFVDLHGFSLKKLDHSIMSLTPCRIAYVPHQRIEALTETHPHLTRLLWLTTNIDAAIHREWVLSLGRRNAVARTAAFFCEMYLRLRTVGMTEGMAYPLAITQGDLAECLGLTAVHVNRTLKVLRERELIEFRNRRVRVLNFEALAKLGEFNDDYLSLEQRHR